MQETKKLENDQLELFDTELMHPSYWKTFTDALEGKVDTSQPFSVLDIGGGNGAFADRLISVYPNVTVTVLDNAEYLLSKNRRHERKRTVCGSATDLASCVGDARFDVITYNWVLHHLVGNSREQSLSFMRDSLSSAATLLTGKGYISIIENLFPGCFRDDFPSRAIFYLTSIRSPLLTPIIRKGFNTAGTGVCFLSEKILQGVIEQTGMKIDSSELLDQWKYSILARIALQYKQMNMRNLWVCPNH